MIQPPKLNIPEGRKKLYYLGKGIFIFGIIFFCSSFLTILIAMFNMTHGNDSLLSKLFILFGCQGFGGMLCIALGNTIANIGRSGMAGSGLLLDPQQARKDLEPYSRAAGGMTADALDEIPLVHTITDKLSHPTPAAPPPLPVVKIRCQHCQTLNEEDAKFCKNCGSNL